MEHFDDASWNLSPLFDPWHPNIRCGEGAFAAAPETQVAKVNAGDEIGFHLVSSKAP